jgi:uncharacterized lipoprotein YddW (UPF0748 family)
MFANRPATASKSSRHSMTARIKILSALVFLAPAMLSAAGEAYRPAAATPPEPPREFRGAWISEVATNQDWPSKPGLPAAQQKAELIALLDRAVQLKLNTVILQVRPACDAMYASPIEPWSAYLTGRMGQPPQPFYDPLAFAVAEAHKRGLELHAWINPFRALMSENRFPATLNHISKTHPEFIRRYGNEVWLDPGEPAVREYVLRVVMDLVRRYDVDGVQFDDYFYPYPEKDFAGRELEFPDDASWRKYGGGLGRDEWRRQNINQFVHGVYQSIKAAKPWVQFGVSPFGIWRPQNPPAIRGLDAYAKLYADSRLWLASGWLDYFAPQLYWPADDFPHSFPVLLNWWSAQNINGRHLWSGLSAANVGEKFPAVEIARQIDITRAQPGASGEIFYHLRNLTDNPALAGMVRARYAQSALPPASPWLAGSPPDRPRLTATIRNPSSVSLRWETSGAKPAWLWILQSQTNQVWTTQILPAGVTAWTFGNSRPDVVSIRAVDRLGNESPPVTLTPVKVATPVRNGKGMMIPN